MPGFSFSPSLRDHRVILLLKSGGKLSGKVVSADPAQVTLQLAEKDEKVVIVNRDEVVAYTGEDDKRREPVKPKLIVTRCCNPMMRCNGVKVISPEKFMTHAKSCELHNEHCELYHGDFFTMSAASQAKLLTGIQVGEFLKKRIADERKDDEQLQRAVRAPQERT